MRHDICTVYYVTVKFTSSTNRVTWFLWLSNRLEKQPFVDDDLYFIFFSDYKCNYQDHKA